MSPRVRSRPIIIIRTGLVDASTRRPTERKSFVSFIIRRVLKRPFAKIDDEKNEKPTKFSNGLGTALAVHQRHTLWYVHGIGDGGGRIIFLYATITYNRINKYDTRNRYFCFSKYDRQRFPRLVDNNDVLHVDFYREFPFTYVLFAKRARSRRFRRGRSLALSILFFLQKFNVRNARRKMTTLRRLAVGPEKTAGGRYVLFTRYGVHIYIYIFVFGGDKLISGDICSSERRLRWYEKRTKSFCL